MFDRRTGSSYRCAWSTSRRQRTRSIDRVGCAAFLLGRRCPCHSPITFIMPPRRHDLNWSYHPLMTHDQADADDAYNFWLFWMKILVVQKVELMVIIFMEPWVFHLLHPYVLLMLVSILNRTSFFLPLKLFFEFFVFQTVLFLTFRQNVVCCPPFLIVVQLLLLFGT